MEAGNRSLILFDRSDEVTVQAGENGIRFLLVWGKPEQLRQAFEELNRGTLLKS